MWGCKRAMVSNCLDKNEDFEGLGSEQLVELVAEFREGLSAMARAEMEMDVAPVEEVTANPLAIMGVNPNKKDKVKVNTLVRAMKDRKKGKVNHLPDFQSQEEDSEESEGPDYEEEPEPSVPDYEAEPEEKEEPDYEPEEEAEDAELEHTMQNAKYIQNDWLDLNQEVDEALEIVEVAEAPEPENKKKHKDALEKPQALYSYVGNGGSKRVNIFRYTVCITHIYIIIICGCVHPFFALY